MKKPLGVLEGADVLMRCGAIGPSCGAVKWQVCFVPMAGHAAHRPKLRDCWEQALLRLVEMPSICASRCGRSSVCIWKDSSMSHNRPARRGLRELRESLAAWPAGLPSDAWDDE